MAYRGIVASILAGRGTFNRSRNISEIPVTDLIQSESITTEDGTWRKAPGAVLLDPNGIVGSPKIVALSDWQPFLGARRILTACSDGKLYKEVGGDLDAATLASGLSGSARPGTWVHAGAESFDRPRKAIYFNGVDAVRVLSGDGAAATVIASPPSDWSGPNQPIHGVVHRQALWAYGNVSDPHRAYKALDTNHEDFVTTIYTLSIFPGMGERLVCGTSFRGLMFLFKTPAGVAWVDDSALSNSNWFPRLVTTAAGAAGPGAVVNMENEVLFLTADGRFLLLSAIDPSSGSIESADLGVALSIDSWLRDNINLDRIDQVVSLWFAKKKKALFGVPRTGSLENDLLLEFDFSRMQVTGKPAFGYSFRDKPVSLAIRREGGTAIPIHGDDAGRVYRMDQEVRSKEGAGYLGRYQIPTTDFSFVDPSLKRRRKNFSFLELVVSTLGVESILADILLEGAFSETLLFNFGGASNVIGSFVLGTDKLAEHSVANRRRIMHGSGLRWSAILYNSTAHQDFSVVEHLVGFTPGAEGP